MSWLSIEDSTVVGPAEWRLQFHFGSTHQIMASRPQKRRMLAIRPAPDRCSERMIWKHRKMYARPGIVPGGSASVSDEADEHDILTLKPSRLAVCSSICPSASSILISLSGEV